MSKLQELIKKLCPNGVEYKKLGEVCISLPKETLKQRQLDENGKYFVVNSGREWYGKYMNYNNEGNAFTIAARGEYAGFINYIPMKFWAGGLCYPYRSKDEKKVCTKFIYYSLKNQEKEIRHNLVARGSIPAINKTDADEIILPIPPFEVQKEIVRILDSFTNLSAELQAELQARKQQYEYYRNKLLTFDNICVGGGYKKISQTVGVNRGVRLVKRDLHDNEKYEVYHGSKDSILGRYDKYNAPADTIIVVNTGGIGGVKFLDKPFWCSDGSFWLGKVDYIDNKYLYYYLSGYEDYFYSQRRIGGVPTIDRSVVENFEIPIPPIEEQKRIVKILDKFYALVSDLSQGLPAEIEAVQQQYEYYRNKLLSFPRQKQTV